METRTLGFGTMVNTRVANDINASFICAGSDTSATSTTASDARQCLTAFATTAQSTLYLNGSYNQGSSASTTAHKRGMTFLTSTQSGVSGGNAVPFPDPMTGKLVLYPITVVESTPTAVRGDLPGLRALAHIYSGSMPPHLAVVEGRGDSTGVRCQMVATGSFYAAAVSLGDWNG